MKFFYLVILLFAACYTSVAVEPERVPIRIYAPSGWVLEVKPNGAGTLTCPVAPYPSATARAYTFDYYHLYRELRELPSGDSVYRYAFVTSEKPRQILAPKDSPILQKTLLKSARILYSQNTEGFYQKRLTHPVFPKDPRS